MPWWMPYGADRPPAGRGRGLDSKGRNLRSTGHTMPARSPNQSPMKGEPAAMLSPPAARAERRPWLPVGPRGGGTWIGCANSDSLTRMDEVRWRADDSRASRAPPVRQRFRWSTQPSQAANLQDVTGQVEPAVPGPWRWLRVRLLRQSEPHVAGVRDRGAQSDDDRETIFA